MRKPLLIITGLFVLLGIIVVTQRLAPPPPQPLPVPPQEKPPEAELFSDPIPQAENVTAQGFQSGGLGLSRQAWEILHGKQPKRVGEWFQYQGQTYSVSFRQEMVWQLKCTWKQPGIELAQARVRVRRYLPLDGQYQQTLTSTPNTVVDQYFSRGLEQLLTHTAKADPQLQSLPQQRGIYTVTYTLEKERVIVTLLQVETELGNPLATR